MSAPDKVAKNFYTDVDFRLKNSIINSVIVLYAVLAARFERIP